MNTAYYIHTKQPSQCKENYVRTPIISSVPCRISSIIKTLGATLLFMITIFSQVTYAQLLEAAILCPTPTDVEISVRCATALLLNVECKARQKKNSCSYAGNVGCPADEINGAFRSIPTTSTSACPLTSGETARVSCTVSDDSGNTERVRSLLIVFDSCP